MKKKRFLLSREIIKRVQGEKLGEGYHSDVELVELSKGRRVARKIPRLGARPISAEEKKKLVESWGKTLFEFRKAGLPVPRWWKADLRLKRGLEPSLYLHYFPKEKGWTSFNRFGLSLEKHRALIEGIAGDLGKIHKLGYVPKLPEDLWMIRMPGQERVIIDIGSMPKEKNVLKEVNNIFELLFRMKGIEEQILFLKNYFKENRNEGVWERFTEKLIRYPEVLGNPERRELYRQRLSFKP
jgi:hypothetical protein